MEASATPTEIAWTADAVLTLGMTTNVETAGAILGIGRTKAYELAKSGDFPSRFSASVGATWCPIPALMALPEG